MTYVPKFGDPPQTPGEYLAQDLACRRITQDELAKAMHVSRYTVNQIINGHRRVTAEMALRLTKVLAVPTVEHWFDLQRDVDLYWARRKIGDSLYSLQPLPLLGTKHV